MTVFHLVECRNTSCLLIMCCRYCGGWLYVFSEIKYCCIYLVFSFCLTEFQRFKLKALVVPLQSESSLMLEAHMSIASGN